MPKSEAIFECSIALRRTWSKPAWIESPDLSPSFSITTIDEVAGRENSCTFAGCAAFSQSAGTLCAGGHFLFEFGIAGDEPCSTTEGQILERPMDEHDNAALELDDVH